MTRTDAERQSAYAAKEGERGREALHRWNQLFTGKGRYVRTETTVSAGGKDWRYVSGEGWVDMSARSEPNAPCCKDATSGNPSSLDGYIAKELARTLDLFRERQAKYGPKNIAEFGEVGILVRLYDKMARLRNYYMDGGAGDMGDESVADAWYDIACYAIIALVCRQGLWPGATPYKGQG